MEVVATSDLHGFFPEIDPCELLIIAGDVCPILAEGNRPLQDHEPSAQHRWICEDFAEWCSEQPADHIVWIGGNHDYGAQVAGFARKAKEAFPENVHYLQDEAIEIDGKHIYGMPWTPNLPNWAFYAPDRAWHWLGEDIPDETDILVMHSPPAGAMLDAGRPDWAAPFIMKQILRVQPELVVCGHIHEGYNERELQGITFANVAYCDEFYDPIQPPKAWEL